MLGTRVWKFGHSNCISSPAPLGHPPLPCRQRHITPHPRRRVGSGNQRCLHALCLVLRLPGQLPRRGDSSTCQNCQTIPLPGLYKNPRPQCPVPGTHLRQYLRGCGSARRRRLSSALYRQRPGKSLSRSGMESRGTRLTLELPPLNMPAPGWVGEAGYPSGSSGTSLGLSGVPVTKPAQALTK